MNAKERLGYTKQLRAGRAGLESGAKGKEKLAFTRAVREARLKLGARAAPPAVNEHVQALRTIASGAQDALGLNGMYAGIKGAVEALDLAALLSGDAEVAANDAITHWARLEVKENG